MGAAFVEMGVCDSDLSEQRPEVDPSDEPESTKRGDAAAALRKMQQQEGPATKYVRPPSSSRQTQGRVIQLCMASRDPELSPRLQATNILWTTQVEDSDTVGDVIEKHYMAKTQSDEMFSALDNLSGLYPHWALPHNESFSQQTQAAPLFGKDTTFSQIFELYPPPQVGAIRFIGELSTSVGLSHWAHPDADAFWRKANGQWIEIK